MYPKTFFDLFPAFPQDNRVFVVMSFHPKFSARWERVIAPGINDAGLEPHRVDARKVSDSILTEILDNIRKSRVIFCDITEMGTLLVDRSDSNPYGVRNGNAMYELGIAHAIRLPEEVLVFRSDSGRLPFDVTSVRVRDYKPDEEFSEARTMVCAAIQDALIEIDHTRNLAVLRVSDSLDFRSWVLLGQAIIDGSIKHPIIRNARHVLSNISVLPALSRMLDLRLLETAHPRITQEFLATVSEDTPEELLFSYRATPFGVAVFDATAKKFLPHPTPSDEDMQKIIEELAGLAGEALPNDTP